MELGQKYILKINNTRSFSRAAKELFISQPSLSLTIKKMEEELGFQIFDRSKNPIELTHKGHIYIEHLENVIRSEKEMENKLERLSQDGEKRIAIGASNSFSHIYLPRVCGEFHKKHPDVNIILDMGESVSGVNRWARLEEKRLDIIFRHQFDETRFSGEAVHRDRYVIAMRRDFEGAERLLPYSMTREELLAHKNLHERAIEDYSIFKNISFIKFGQSGSVWSHMYELMEHCTFSPCTIQYSPNFETHYNMMLYGMGAVITSKMLVESKSEGSDEVMYFPTNVHRQLFAIYRKDEAPSDIQREFIDLTRDIAN